jgi:predicted nucleic acid-binding protein
MFTLDANIFVRELTPRDPAYPACQALLERLRADNIPVIIPLIVLAEVGGAISRTVQDPIRARVFVELLRDLPNVTLVPLDTALAQEAADSAADHALRGMDAIYVAVARRPGRILDYL